MTTNAMNKTLARAIARCPAVKSLSLGQFLGGLLDEEPQDLAKLPGTPATVLSAQFTCYAKSSANLAEVLSRQNDASRQLIDAVWRIKPLEQKKRIKTLEATSDSDSLADKRCRACAACA
jgi:hypothetical protein